MPTKHIDLKSFASRIRQFRLEKEIKQAAAAQELAIRQSAYSDIENGKTEIKVSQLCKLACLFGREMKEFFEDPPPPAH